MKDFFKFTFATVLGIIISSVLLFLVTLGTVFSMLSSSDTEIKVKPETILTINLNGTVTERSVDNPLSMLQDDAESETYGLDDILSAIKKATEEENIKGIYLTINNFAAAPATIEEFRGALKNFKESGKFIIAYSDNYSQGAYYLASVADEVMLNPQGTINWVGVYSQFMSYKELLDKVGVKMQIFKVGTYKSAVEPFILKEMSEANREQVKAFTSSIWETMLANISESRDITVDSLKSYADEGLIFAKGETFVDCGMVDTLIYRNDVVEYLKKKMDVDKDDDLTTLTLDEMKSVKRSTPKDPSGNLVAIYYADGEIDDTKAKDHIGALRVIKDLKKLEKDEDVKAVVIRVNSPGGSAFGSEQIWKEIKDIKSKKPVVVSMGDYAASGGYYISCNADYIFAQPTTLTGSIGIYGMVPDASGLVDKVGLSFETVGTGKFGDAMNITQPMNEEASALLQKSVNEGYELFVQRCAEGRKMTTESIKKIAEGRVWTGTMAKDLGLVDEIGSLDDAVNKAVELAEIEKYSLVSYPEKPSMLENIINSLPASYMSIFGKGEVSQMYKGLQWIEHIDEINPVQARMPYYVTVK